jgi:hypothetical protein
LVFVVGCAKKEAPKEEATSRASDAGAKAASSDAGVAKAPVDAASANNDEAEARALLDAWLAAQNEGTFDAYEKLYDATFEGIRRTGDKTVTLDRAKWMKDRKRMFAKALHVEATDLKVTRAGEELELHFVQTFAAGSYRDQGEKVMRILAGKIRREEMLSSKKLPPVDAGVPAGDAGAVAMPDSKASDDTAVTFGFTLAPSAAALELARVEDGEVLLAQTDVDIGSGPIEIIDREDYLSYDETAAVWVARDIDDAPKALEAAIGLEVAVLDASLKPVCTARIGDELTLTNAGNPPKHDEHEMIKAAWKDAPYVVTATLEGGCEGEFVRAAALPALATGKVSAKEEKKIVKAVKKRFKNDDDYPDSEVEVTVVAAADGAHFYGANIEVTRECVSKSGVHFEAGDANGAILDASEGKDQLIAAVVLGAENHLHLVFATGAYDTVAKKWTSVYDPDLTVNPGETACDGYEGD